MKSILLGLLLIYICFVFIAMNGIPIENAQTSTTKATVSYFKENSKAFAGSCQRLNYSLDVLDSSKKSKDNAIVALRDCRIAYKRIAFFMDYFLTSAALIYNQPPNPEVEVPFMEASEPVGLQVIESLLFQQHSEANLKALQDQARLLYSSAIDLNSLLFNLDINDRKIMESLNLSLIYMVTLEISGFDAPELKSGINEAATTLATLKDVILPYTRKDSADLSGVILLSKIDAAVSFLADSPNFDSFDRLKFSSELVIPLQDALKVFVKKSGYGSERIREQKLLFEPYALDFGQALPQDSLMISLGRNLFNERMLSGNMKRSCSSCHNPQLYFTDGKPTNTSVNEESLLKRNTPTLLYSALQHSQFWDGRASSIEELILQVMQSPLEMNANISVVEQRLNENAKYRLAFSRAFPDSINSGIDIKEITKSLNAYLNTLTFYNSRFDKYMNGKQNALSTKEKRGYNLFMGKAQCGTCHFAPIFNGLVPPYYDRTDLEVLGTTANANFFRPELDSDNGRFDSYAMENYQGAFKTPTLRNIGKTAPYMHNGAFSSLNEVIEFYNKGGGNGLGLKVPMQTLSSKPLNLNKKEVNEIVAFLNSLSDTIN